MNKDTTQQNYTTKKLHLSSTDKRLLGVCGGIAQYFGIDSTIVRIGWVILTVASGVFPGVLAYIVAAIVMPHEDEQA